MNKRIFSLGLLSVIILSGINARAQQLYIGARIGANLANESANLPSGYSMGIRTGFLAGGQFDDWFDNKWALSAQVLYDQKGAHEDISDPIPGLTGAANFVYNYLEIPILLNVTFGTGDIRPYVFAGPSFGIFLSGNDKVTSTYQGVTTDTTISEPDSDVKSPDIAAVFGAGVSLKLSSGPTLFFDASYALGLVNIVNTQPGDNTNIKSRDIRLAAGILFPVN